MKVDNYSKFILLVIQIYSVKSNRISSRSSDAVSSAPVASVVLESLPYLVLVFISVDRSAPLSAYNGRACTGTLLRQDLVITLASCLLLYYDDEPDPGIVTVVERPGRHKLRVHRILINPNFYAEDQDVSKAHDFGLLIVDKSSQTVFPQLPKGLETFTTIKNTCEMGGYGITGSVDVGNFIAIRINDTDVEELKGRRCNARKRICLHFGNLMTCKNGDFGSPLICRGIVYAVNSPQYHRHRQLQLKCINAHITVFTPIYNVKDWVKQIEEDTHFSYLKWMNKDWFVLVLCLVVFTSMASIYCGLMQLLQTSLDSLDPVEGMQQSMSYESHFEDEEEDWYEDQWTT